MSPLITDKPPVSERMLAFIHPLFAFLSKRFPRHFGCPSPPLPHASAMLKSCNVFYRLLFPRFFKKIGVDESAINMLRHESGVATIVYVAKQLGQLEYNYFSHLFQSSGLPLAVYNNALTLRRWMRAKDYWLMILDEEHQIGSAGRISDPLTDGTLPQMLAAGESVFLKIGPSSLEDEGLFFTGPIQTLVALINAQRMSERPISMVPLDFVWSRRPESPSRSVIDILFGEKESPGRLRKLVLFWRNYKRQARATIAPPINLKTFLADNPNTDEELASKLRELLMQSLKTERHTLTGPPIRPRNWFIQEVLGDDDLDSTACRIAAERGKDADDLRELAARYAREIVSDLDYTYIELLDLALERAFAKIFESFQVDIEGLKVAKALYSKGPIIFTPNHKSHVDYLILSYVLYHNGMTVPHIAAGLNLSFWPLGKVFRHCGAYFIRRRFRDNPLYRAVLETYLKVLMKAGYSQEFFIEGGRSRTGKLMPPKMGMLAMQARAAKRSGIKTFQYIPVAITYDRVIEQKGFISELEGASKPKERPSHLLKLTKYLRRGKRRYGSIYVRFGRPIEWGADAEDARAIEKTIQSIYHQINKNAVATPASITAGALLTNAQRGVTFEDFKRKADLLTRFLKWKGVHLSDRLAATQPAGGLVSITQEAVSHFDSMKLVSMRSLAFEPFFYIEESKRMPLAFFKNGIAHFFASIGVLCLILKKGIDSHYTLTVGEITPAFEAGRRVLAHEFRFATRMPVEDHILAALGFLKEEGIVTQDTGEGRLQPVTDYIWALDLFASQIQPFVETITTAFLHTIQSPIPSCEEKTLISEMMRTGEDLLLLGRIRYRESITKDGLKNALGTLISSGILISETPELGKRRQNRYRSTDDKIATTVFQVELERLIQTSFRTN